MFKFFFQGLKVILQKACEGQDIVLYTIKDRIVDLSIIPYMFSYITSWY